MIELAVEGGSVTELGGCLLAGRWSRVAAYPVDSGSSICSVLSDRPRSVAGTYTDGQGALAF